MAGAGLVVSDIVVRSGFVLVSGNMYPVGWNGGQFLVLFIEFIGVGHDEYLVDRGGIFQGGRLFIQESCLFDLFWLHGLLFCIHFGGVILDIGDE